MNSFTEDDLCHFATQLAEHIVAGDIIFLSGTLGAGKSVFARALIRALMQNPDLNVPSPTFTLLQIYDVQSSSPSCELWHYDLYRLEEADDVFELGWEDATNGPILLVEWPQRLGNAAFNPLFPPRRIELSIAVVPDQPDIRTIEMALFGEWSTPINDLQTKAMRHAS
jgi:tRNA threonylcarbamoyladenosine biosynthesis protein TsaE